MTDGTEGDGSGRPPTNGGLLASYTLRPVEQNLVFQQRSRGAGREIVRALLALLALLLVILTIVLGFMASQHSHWDAAKDWLSAVLPAETGILGSALGFYFGTQSDRRDQNPNQH